MALGLLLFYHRYNSWYNNDRSGPEKKFIFSMLEGGPAHSCGAVAVAAVGSIVVVMLCSVHHILLLHFIHGRLWEYLVLKRVFPITYLLTSRVK